MPEPIVDSIEVVSSEDGGNGMPPGTPSPTPTPATPAEPTEAVTPTENEEQLYELPDGRKVDGETLTREWKENFLPDYTRKSQALAAKENPVTNPQPTTPNPLDDPNYVPTSYGEIARIAKEQALAEFEAREQAKIDQQKEIEDMVVSQLAEIKKSDPTINENALFLHANKYGFRDLRQAHANMKDMSETMKKVKQTTATDIAKRADPVSVPVGSSSGGAPDASNFASAVDYLRSLKG